jgi:hypothetical protein
VSGVIHAYVVPEHLEESLVIAVFFTGLAAAQIGLAGLLLWRPSPPLWVLAIIGHLGLLVLYVASRTMDLWFLPAHHHFEHLPVAGGVGNGTPIYPGNRTESVGALDLSCQVVELVLIVALLTLLPERARAWFVNVMVGLAVLGVLGRVLGLLG